MDEDEAETDVAAIADALRDADTAVAFTGAGVSTASGIPSFRGDDGVWETEFDPQSFHVSRFRSDPAGFWADRLELHERMFPDDVAPNAAHDALASLEAEGHLDAVITQNTDGLHQRAGSEDVVELHGANHRVECQECKQKEDAEPARERARDGELPPTCRACGGPLKPDVVLFGEQLPTMAMHRARELADDADAFLVAGSSLTVEPAASLPRRAARDGHLSIVNFDETESDRYADVVVRGDVTEVLPEVEERV
ncbi:NAD-dependent deacylase [Halospeciosus flavus]|uniref:NAD-dependent protein deacylase n=1 Tax=Halospeciosus flavus TaxID=3032283 RepID=A0ABD5Z456_9EURY|nr:NAD-dependent deacylase [Halospeciosus flavus]